MSSEKVSMKLSTYQAGTPRKRGEGLRIGAVRFLPRGVRKKDYARLDFFDVWLPILALSRKLLGWLRGQELTRQISKQFFDRYKRELLSNTDARQVIQMLAELSSASAVTAKTKRGVTVMYSSKSFRLTQNSFTSLIG